MQYLTRVLIFFWSFISLSVLAQDRFNIRLNQENGLPSNYVYDIFQDSKGFIWMATDVGLYRYDGFEYKLYASEMQSSLAGSCIQEDIFGRIWYENFDGYLFYIEDGKLNQINQNSPIQFLPYGISGKYLYLIDKVGVSILDLKTLKLVKQIPVDFVYAENANLINGYFFITDQDKMICIDPKFNVFQTNVGIVKQMGIKLVKSINGMIAVVTRDGKTINYYTQNLNFIGQSKLNLKGTLQDVFQVKDDVYGFATSKGIELIELNGLAVKRIASSWQNTSVAKQITDNAENKWLVTLGEGVIMIPPKRTENSYIKSKGYGKISPYGNLYVAASNNGGVDLLNADLSLNRSLVKSNNYIHYLSLIEGLRSFIYTDNQGLHLFGNGKHKHINVALKEVVELDSKFYLVAVSGFYGLFKNPFAPKDIKSEWDNFFIQNVFNLENFSAFKSHIRAKTIDYNRKTKEIAVGTNVGTFINKGGVERELKLDGNSFFVKKIWWLDNKLYALTTNGDFYKVNNPKQLEKIELPEGGIRLVKQQDHHIYLIGSNLMYVYDVRSRKAIQYDIDFNNNTINDFVVEGDYIVIVTDNEISRIRYKNQKLINMDVPFYINGTYVNGVKADDLKALSHTQNNIRINYSFLNYGRKNGVVVSYRVNNEAWIVANENDRNIFFRALAPGNYVVSFKLNDKEVDQQVIIGISVPFWRAWWFYALVLVVSVGAISYYFTTRTKIFAQQIKLLNEKIQLEKSLGRSVLTSIKAQMNPHFFYNALNTIQGFIFTNDKVSANNYLAKFSKLTRLVLEMSEKESVGLSEEIDSIKMYLDLEKMRFGEKFRYEIQIQDIPNLEMIELPPMLVQPLVENAVKHGLLHLDKEGCISVSYRKELDFLMVTVEDNGIGRKRSAELKLNKAKKHNSFAMKANQTRLDILNKDRSDKKFLLEIVDKYDNGYATGTIARLSIPLE